MKPNRKTIRDSLRASVPEGKLLGAKIVLRDSAENSPIGGFTEYDRAKGGRVTKIGGPTGDDAFGIAIRAHEAAHATHHKPTRKKLLSSETEAVVSQIVDDVDVESKPVPSVPHVTQYKRAKLTVAMRDVRNIARAKRRVKAGTLKDSVALRNGDVTCAVRCIGMLRNYGEIQYGEAYSLDEMRAKERGFKALRKALGDRMFRAAAKVAEVATSRRRRAKAISMLLALMEEDEQDNEPEKEEGPETEGDILAPVEHGDGLDGHMEIINLLPKSAFCSKEKRVSRRFSPTGVIINPNRFVAAIVSGNGNGLFSRRVRQKQGGCVLIDASGSMSATCKNLSAICRLVPTATLGYYSGYDTGRGDLCIYALNGQRFDGELPQAHLHGGNCVDLPAIRWLMERPKPWVLVSDLKFCGGVLGSETVAKAIVEREVSRGNMTVYRSLDEAFAAFGGKGQLKN